MSKSAWLISIVGALFIAFVGFSLWSLEWEKTEIETGFSEEARKDPLIAAKRFLASKQVELKKLTGQEDFIASRAITLDKNSSFIVDEAALSEYHHFEKALLQWVEAGGHLIYLMSPRRDSLEIANSLILQSTNISIVPSENRAFRLNLFAKPDANIEFEQHENEYLTWYMPYQFAIENCQGEALKVKNSETTVICDQALGGGFITFMSSIHPISNDGLRHLDHGELLLWLVGENNYLWYLPSLNSPNWLITLWRWSNLFVVTFVALLLLIMWFLAVRFGRARTPHSVDKNIFAEHIQATGNLLVQQSQFKHLKQVLLTDIEHAMEVRSPRFKQLSVEEQSELLSQLSGLNKQSIIRILSEDLPEGESDRFHYIKLFKQLRNAL